MERYSHWAMSYPLGPAGNGYVMQGHTDYCAKFGHATYTKDGVVMSWCPRCGDSLELAAAAGQLSPHDEPWGVE